MGSSPRLLVFPIIPMLPRIPGRREDPTVVGSLTLPVNLEELDQALGDLDRAIAGSRFRSAEDVAVYLEGRDQRGSMGWTYRWESRRR